MVEFEVLAAECRSDSFRESLGQSDVWVQVAQLLEECMNDLEVNICMATASNLTIDGQPVSDGVNGGDHMDDDGMGYTLRVDRNQTNALLSQHNSTGALNSVEFSPTSIQILDKNVVVERLATATSVFRFLRNACAACKPNQAQCHANHLIQKTHMMIMRCCFWMDTEDDTLKRSVVLLSQIALQFCVNCVTGNEQNQQIAWELFFPDDFQKVLVECHQHRKVIAFTTALLLNCVNSSEAMDAVKARRIDLVCARNLVITLLQRCLQKPTPSTPSSDTTLGFGRQQIDEDDPAFEWICVLFHVLFRAGHMKDLYNAVGAHMLSKLWSRVTPEQLILLRMLTMWITSTPSAARTTSTVQEHTDDVHENMKVSTMTFEFITSTWIYVITVDNEDRPDDVEEVRKLMWIQLENDAKLMLLDIMGELTLHSALLHGKIAQDLLCSLLQELQRVWSLRPLGMNKKTNVAGDAASVIQLQEKYGEPFGYRSGLIRAIGNLCYRHSVHQDLVREEGYIPLFLNHCNIDEANPMLREWSLVALRNLCEGNEPNQAYINALRPQGMDSASASVLENAHVQAEIDEDGKVRLKKK